MEESMRFLTVLEWAFGAFLVVFVVWQIAVPLLMGQPVFSWFTLLTEKKDEGKDHDKRDEI